MTSAVVRIVGRDLPGLTCGEHTNVHLGVQRRQEIIDIVRGDADSAVFEMPIDVVRKPEGDVDYRGPFVHGKRGARFFYLSWGDVSPDGIFTMFGRAKLNFAAMPADVLAAIERGGSVTGQIGLTGKRGGPLYASISRDSFTWTIEDRPPIPFDP